MNTIADRVAKGAAEMDEKVPGWASLARPDRDDIEFAMSILVQFNRTVDEPEDIAAINQRRWLREDPKLAAELGHLWRSEVARRLVGKEQVTQ